MSDLPQAIYLVTGVNQPYLARAGAYIASMSRNSNVGNIVITLDFEIPAEYRQSYPSIRFLSLSSRQVKSPNSNTCMQHGGFLPALDFLHDEDVILYTDADIEMQRAFHEDELHLLGGLRDGEVGVSFNRSPDDRLADEAQRLTCHVSPEDLSVRYPGIDKLRTYNTGVIAAQRGTYQRLYDLYDRHWEDFHPLFESYAKQQWLLSYLIQKHFQPKGLPDTIHTHGHYPIPLRVREPSGYKFCIGAQPVVLSHAVRHEAEEEVRRLEKQARRLNRRSRRLVAALIAVSLLCGFLIVREFL